jgi:tRNA-Thr(GGU) m(6)t(6)A37 methyltransferase TsaA
VISSREVPAFLELNVRDHFPMRPIGWVRTGYHDVDRIPKGLGARHDAEGDVVIDPVFEAGLRDIEGFSHLYVLWVFDRVDAYDLTAWPPSDDRPHGVFATRSPQRPNPIGLTVVELLGREGATLHVRGVDMLDGTPVVDLKPFFSNVPPERLRLGWFAEAEARRVSPLRHFADSSGPMEAPGE